MYLSVWVRPCSNTECQDCRLQTSSHVLGSDAKQSSRLGAELVLPGKLTALQDDSDRQSQWISETIQTELPEEIKTSKDIQVPKRSTCLKSANTSVHYDTTTLFQIHRCICRQKLTVPSFFLSFSEISIQIFYIPLGIKSNKVTYCLHR